LKRASLELLDDAELALATDREENSRFASSFCGEQLGSLGPPRERDNLIGFPMALQDNAAQKAFAIDGKYRLERELAAGGIGMIWAAGDIELGRAVAIKFRPEISCATKWSWLASCVSRARSEVHAIVHPRALPSSRGASR
jgi:hypothetical protein